MVHQNFQLHNTLASKATSGVVELSLSGKQQLPLSGGVCGYNSGFFR